MHRRRRRRDHRAPCPALAGHRDAARRPRHALRRTEPCSRSSAWSAATSRGSAWKEYRRRARWPASRCPAGCARATASSRRSSPRRPRRSRATTRTSPSPTVRAGARRRRRRRSSSGSSRRGLRPRPRHRRAGAASSSPTRSSSSGAIATARSLLIDEVLTPGQLALLAGRALRSRVAAAELRQAAAARLPRREAARGTLERRRAAAAASARASSRRRARATSSVSGAHRRATTRSCPHDRASRAKASLHRSVACVIAGCAAASAFTPLVGPRVLCCRRRALGRRFFRDPERDGDRGHRPRHRARRRQGRD